MRNTVEEYCRSLERGDCARAVELMDPDDLLAFWQSLCDMETALRRVGEVSRPQELLGEGVDVDSFREMTPQGLLVRFLQRTLTGLETIESEVLTVDEVSPGRGLAVYKVAGFSNTMDLIHKKGRWYVKLRLGLKEMALSYQEKVLEFERRASKDKPTDQTENLGSFTLVGFADSGGEVKIHPRFPQAEEFSEGLAAVKLISQWGYIDGTGKVVIPARFSRAYSFQEGVAWVIPTSSSDWNHALIDKNGRELLPAQFSSVEDFSEGLAAVKKDGKWGYVDKTGAWVIEPKYVFAEPFEEGLAEVGLEDGAYMYIDKKGEPLDPSLD